MATNKKSVILYCDLIQTVEKLTDEEAGKLFKHYLRYINDLNPEPPDRLTDVTFEPIKQSLLRDLEKWDKQLEQRRLAGKKSAEIRATNANERSTKLNERSISSTDSVSDSVNVSDSVINISFDTFWDLYDKKVGDKNKLIKKWKVLTNKDREQIIQYVPKYKIAQPDKQYRKNPETFFNNKSWLDEIILPTSAENKPAPIILKTNYGA